MDAPNTTYASIANYYCVDGYRLVGETTRSCLSTSVWSGSEPLCICKLIVLLLLVTCTVYAWILMKKAIVVTVHELQWFRTFWTYPRIW